MGTDHKHSIEAKNIIMEFPGVKALDGVSFTMRSGEIRAIIGANGAGKSTLMNVISGILPAYKGDVSIDGSVVKLSSPVVAKNMGIALVSQEVDNGIVPSVSVAENIMLDYLVNEMGKNFVVNWKYVNQKAKEALDKLNVQIDINKQAGELTLAEKQMVLIARAISQKCHFLILDEPTSALSLTETEVLFRVLRELMQKNDMGIIFISHRLRELFEICDHITVMRNGKVVSELGMENLTIEDVVSEMLGNTTKEPFIRKQGKLGDKLLEVENLCDESGKVKNISFYARAGEVIGISGLVGAGKTELAKCLFGENPKLSGSIRVHGKEISVRTPHEAVKAGLGLVPEERRKEGVQITYSVKENLSTVNLDNYTRFGFVNRAREKAAAEKMVEELRIKTPSVEQTVAFLSGGNQQKVVIGKWLGSDCEIYIMDEPTKGVDVGAKQEIYKLIQRLADEGKCVLYLTSETMEILSVTDRLYVLYNGEISAEMKTSDATEEKLMFYATGGIQ